MARSLFQACEAFAATYGCSAAKDERGAKKKPRAGEDQARARHGRIDAPS
jgi:hypothetical protein